MKYLLALLLIAPAFAQTPDDAATAACRKHSQAITVTDPAKLMQAQEADFQKCMVMNIPSVQRREDALYREKASICNADADIEQVREKLTVAERKGVFAKCMAPRYIVQ
jgi:hypothetical protein